MPTPISPQPDLDVVDRYLAGTLDAESCARFDAYCAAHPRYGAAIAALRSSASRGELTPPIEASVALTDVWARADAADAQAAVTRTAVHAPPHTSSRWLRAVAAAAIVAVGLAGREILRRTPSATDAVRTYHTTTGQRATIRLADGSEVILAPQTMLTVMESFGRGTRDVSLVGEARFDVVPDRDAPFTVHTGPVSTRVLGTRFDIARYATDRVTRVAVASGKVSSGACGHVATLTAGMTGRFDDSTALTASGVSSDAMAAWVNDRLVFTDVPVSTMLATLSRWYGYDFKLDDSALAARHANVEFDVANPEETMRLLQGLLHVTMTRHDSTVILRPMSPTPGTQTPASRDGRTMTSSNTEVGR